MGFREGMFLLRALLAVAGGARQRGGGENPWMSHIWSWDWGSLLFIYMRGSNGSLGLIGGWV